MREQELRRRLEQHVGPTLVHTWVRDVVISQLGERTVEQALADGVPARDVWRAVWAFLELPERDR